MDILHFKFIFCLKFNNYHHRIKGIYIKIKFSITAVLSLNYFCYFKKNNTMFK